MSLYGLPVCRGACALAAAAPAFIAGFLNGDPRTIVFFVAPRAS